MEKTFDLDFMFFVIDRCVPMPVILKRIEGRVYDYTGKCFCPFHQNYDSPAAKIYRSENGDRLFCFSEQRNYRPSDVIRNKLIKTPAHKLFYRIWEQLPEEKRSMLRDSQGVEENITPLGWREARETLDLFKRGQVTYTEHLCNILEALE